MTNEQLVIELRKNMQAITWVAIIAVLTMVICCGIMAKATDAKWTVMQREVNSLRWQIMWVECVNDSRAAGNPCGWCDSILENNQ